MGRRWTVAALFLMAGIVGMVFGPTFGATQTDGIQETVTVSAANVIEVPPELAKVTLSVRVTAATARSVGDELAARTNRVVDAMKDAGFTEDQLSVGNVSVRQRRDRDGNVVGFVGNTSVSIETDDLDVIGNIIDTGLAAGATGVRGVKFDVNDNSEAVKEALRRAMNFAIEKARVLAETAGRQLGRALVIREGGTSEPRPQVFDAAIAGRVSGGGAAPFPIIPPDLTVRARIEATFALQ